jgi:hypothetical protein
MVDEVVAVAIEVQPGWWLVVGHKLDRLGVIDLTVEFLESASIGLEPT